VNPYVNRYQNAYQRALARQLAAHPELSYTSPGLRPDIAQGLAAPGRSGAVQHPQSSGSSSGATATAPSLSAAVSPASGAVTPVGRATPAGAGAGSSAVAGGPQRRSAAPLAGAPGAAAPAGAGTPGQNAQNATSGVRGGAPTGGTEAGHSRGTTQSAASTPAQLAAGPDGLPLEGAYEPGRPGGKAQAGETGGGGGGHARDRAIAGGVASSPSDSAFPYIPPDAAAVPDARQDLLANYLDVITSLAGRSW
jgi:hypothetical protein